MKRIGFEDLVEKTAVTAVVSKEQARKVIKAYLEEVKLELCKGDTVALREFGTFNPIHRAERQGHNPTTGEAITIPAKDTITFRISQKFKDMLNS